MDSPRAPRWSIRLPDLRGRRAVVTGASDGVGAEIARGLARAGAEVVLPVRNRAKGEGVVARIRAEVPDAALELVDLDLAELGSVAGCADALRADGRPIHLFVLNAGMIALGDPVRHTSVDGFELHFQTNHLGHFALALGILPLLQAGRARVTVQSSLATSYVGIPWDDLQLERRYSAVKAYGASKVALSLFGLELGRRSSSAGWGVTTDLSHPGISASTNIAPAALREGRGIGTRIGRKLTDSVIGGSPAEASLPALFAVASPDSTPGALYGPAGFGHFQGPPRPQRLPRRLRDEDAAARCWATSEELAGIRLK
jgi:NAD(P)-dependent dehydrogenase (short-subunit alcohol dehydrogenase family)